MLSRICLASLLTLVLVGCDKPQTPQEVTQAFWAALIANDAANAVEYSTLASAADFNAFGRSWEGMTPSWGKVVIEDKAARIHTQVSRPDASAGEMLYFITFLVREGEDWKVDYRATEKGVLASGAVVDFVDSMTTLGEDLQRQYGESVETLSIEMAVLIEQLSRMAETYRGQADSAMSDYAARMRRQLDALAGSLGQALEENRDGIEQATRETLDDAIRRLNAAAEQLKAPTLDIIADVGEQIMIIGENLARLDSEALAGFADEWRRLIEELELEFYNLLDEFGGNQPRQI